MNNPDATKREGGQGGGQGDNDKCTDAPLFCTNTPAQGPAAAQAQTRPCNAETRAQAPSDPPRTERRGPLTPPLLPGAFCSETASC